MNILVLDGWLFIQLGNFILLLVVLNYVLVAPIRRILKERAERMAAQSAEIGSFAAAADAKLKNYAAALEEARREAGTVRAALREEALVREKALLEAAAGQAGESLKAARATIASESDAALKAMMAMTPALASKAAARILGQAR